jgi:hypothetical protein
MRLDPVTLENDFVRLEPIAERHRERCAKRATILISGALP